MSKDSNKSSKSEPKLTNFSIHSRDGVVSADRFEGPRDLHVLMAIFVCIRQTGDQGLPARPSAQVISAGGFGEAQSVTSEDVLEINRSGPRHPLIQLGNAHDRSEDIYRHLGRRQLQLIEELAKERM